MPTGSEWSVLPLLAFGRTGDDAPEAVCAVAGEYLWDEGHYLVAVATPPACPRRLLLASYGLGAGVDQAAMTG